jgi:hypothetical protein
LAWFVDFLERRARVKAPRWWAEAILDARANRRGNVYPGGINMTFSREPHPQTAPAPPEATFASKDGHPVVCVGTESVPVPADLQSWPKEHGGRVNVRALITPSRCYVAVHGNWGYPYKLACVDRSSGEIRWISEVWGSWWDSTSGHSHEWVELTEQGDQVVVFGASGGFNVEAFRIEDGANVFRVSNGYSGP